MAFAPFYNGSKYGKLFTRKVMNDSIQNLIFGLAYHFIARQIGECFACTRVQQAHEIVYLGNGTYRRAWITRSGFLFNGNYRAQAVDLVHIGALQVANKTAGISRKTFHVPALAFCINSIECKR